MLKRAQRGSAVFVVFAALVAAGCASTSSHDRLLKRAAFDLHCTKDELSVTRLDSKTRGVRGCGRQATYLQVCELPNNPFAECSWVMNSRGHASHDDDDDDDE
jgi:hypothetical protein